MLTVLGVLVAVYPRVCGVDGGFVLPLLSPSGLSPRVRGRCILAHGHHSFARFIPACAG